GVVGAEPGLLELERFLEQRQGRVQLAGGLVAQGQVVHAGEGVRVVGAEPGLAEVDRLLEQGQGLFPPARGLVAQTRGVAVEGRGRVGGVGGWWGPRRALLSLSVSWIKGRALSSWPAAW